MSNNNWPYSTDHTALGKLVLSKSNEDTLAVDERDIETTSVNDKSNASLSSVISSVAFVSCLGALCLIKKR